MELLLTRDNKLPNATTGDLTIEGQHECFICEDMIRDGPKVLGKTAIPAGRYEIAITFSDRFQKPLPLLLNVPNFTGIRIHPGNSAADTDGCLLPGTLRDITLGTVQQSVLAFNMLFIRLSEALRHEKVFITIQ